MTDKEKIFTAARNLADTVSGSDIYKKYRGSLLKLKETPDLFLRAQAFKEAVNTREPGNPVSLEEEKVISRRYTELTNNPDTAAFLADESEFLQVYSGILAILDDAVEMELFS